MTLNLKQLRTEIVVPVLDSLNMNSLAAQRLVIGTGLAESNFEFLRQYPAGPAMGVYQIEIATHDDLWRNYLAYHPDMRAAVERWIIPGQPRAKQLCGNLYYATAMCRIFYRRVKAPMPAADDWEGFAHYWKQYYNTYKGKGTVEGFLLKTTKPGRSIKDL